MTVSSSPIRTVNSTGPMRTRSSCISSVAFIAVSLRYVSASGSLLSKFTLSSLMVISQ